MDRPTSESLEESLEHAEGLLVYEIAKTRELLPSELALLDCAAEVIALRQELTEKRVLRERPRVERVEQALAGHYGYEHCRMLGKDDDVCVLAAEVCALRDTVAGVEALSERWVKDSFPLGEQKYDERRRELGKCATQLRKLLAKAALNACASSEPDTAPISAPDGQAAEPVVLENPAKQRGKLL